MTDSYEFGRSRGSGFNTRIEDLEEKKRKEEEYQKLVEEKAKKAVLDERLSNSYEVEGITYDAASGRPIDADGNFLLDGEQIVTPETTSSNAESSNTGGFSSYSKELLEEERAFQALEKRLVSPATVLEGAVYHHFNADGSFAGISQGEPLEGTIKERKDALAARDAANAANTLSKEQQRDLERVSNDPSLANEILEKSKKESERLDKKISQEEGTFDFNKVKPWEGGTIQPSEAPENKVKYPYNWTQVTSAGHKLEFNNTEESERIRILNKNGNLIQMDEKNDTYLKSKNDTYILSDHNLVIQIGSEVGNGDEGDPDRLVLHVIGNVHMYVEGDMHTEVEGNRYDTVNGNWQQTCGGVMTTRAEENLAITSKNTMRLTSNSYINKTTFLLNDLSEGGSVKENVKGNYEVKIQKPTATFSVKSDGDVRIQSNMCRYDFIGRNYMTEVRGKVSTQVEGNDLECINGGAFEGMVNIAPFPNSSYDITVTGNTSLSNTGDYNISAGGNVNIAGTEIYLN